MPLGELNLITDIEQLLAREQIKQVRARYFRCVDSRNWEGFLALFRPDAVLDLTDDLGHKFRGHEEILSVVRGIEGSVSVHHGHMPEIEFTSATRASGIWAMEDVLFWAPGSKSPISKLHGYGHYHDVYVCTDGRWQFESVTLRRIRVDTE